MLSLVLHPYQNSKENVASALLSEGNLDMTEGAKKEHIVAVMYMIPIAKAPSESTHHPFLSWNYDKLEPQSFGLYSILNIIHYLQSKPKKTKAIPILI